MTEGKVIRVDEKGYEIFEDFLSESGILFYSFIFTESNTSNLGDVLSLYKL